MRKYIIIAFLLIFTVSLFGYPFMALSANEASFTADTTISLTSGDFIIGFGSQCDQMVVDTTTIQFTLSANSSVSIRSYNRYLFDNDGDINTDCSSNPVYSQLSLSGPSSGTTTVTVTPSSSTCPTTTGGGGGGSGVGSSVITTATAAGGEITATTTEGDKASVEVPANAVSASTEIKIFPKTKVSIIASRPIPSGKNVVGNYVFDFTATANSQATISFSKDVTLTFTYTDEQIVGLNEDTLKVHYWDGSQWLGLETTVDKTNNQVSASTNHFTYFVIMGSPETPSEMADPLDYGLNEGDLVRAEGDFDIFIINQYGYKRLFLNPAIFEMYGHLGSWDDVITVSPATRDAFITSTHYRYVNEDKVYHLEVSGEDTGTLQWINMNADDFTTQGGTINAIFTINKSELDWYPKGTDKTSL